MSTTATETGAAGADSGTQTWGDDVPTLRHPGSAPPAPRPGANTDKRTPPIPPEPATTEPSNTVIREIDITIDELFDVLAPDYPIRTSGTVKLSKVPVVRDAQLKQLQKKRIESLKTYLVMLLSQLTPLERAVILTILAAKGGVGKTPMTAGICSVIAEYTRKLVVAVDANDAMGLTAHRLGTDKPKDLRLRQLRRLLDEFKDSSGGGIDLTTLIERLKIIDADLAELATTLIARDEKWKPVLAKLTRPRIGFARFLNRIKPSRHGVFVVSSDTPEEKRRYPLTIDLYGEIIDEIAGDASVVVNDTGNEPDTVSVLVAAWKADVFAFVCRVPEHSHGPEIDLRTGPVELCYSTMEFFRSEGLYPDKVHDSVLLLTGSKEPVNMEMYRQSFGHTGPIVCIPYDVHIDTEQPLDLSELNYSTLEAFLLAAVMMLRQAVLTMVADDHLDTSEKVSPKVTWAAPDPKTSVATTEIGDHQVATQVADSTVSDTPDDDSQEATS